VHGHITSLAVLRTHRKLGIAAKLMRAAHDAMAAVFDAEYCSLHVRVSNQAAIHLYVDVLGYEKKDVERAYYADGEDAHDMRKTFERLKTEMEKSGEGDETLAKEVQKLSV
jgi:ribosomal protein S18 acetylase RimI-like enzyme